MREVGEVGRGWREVGARGGEVRYGECGERKGLVWNRPWPDHLRRVPPHDYCRGYILHNHRPRGDNAVIANCDSGIDERARTDPDSLPNRDRRSGQGKIGLGNVV